MRTIQRIQNWSTHDYLNDTILKNGEKLKIEFPDGFTKVFTINVDEFYKSISDHGKMDSYAQSESYIIMKFHGVKTKIKIAGLKAKRVKK